MISIFKRFPILSLIFITLIVRGVISFLYITELRNLPWSAHMYVDIWSWLPYLEKCFYGYLPYVDFSKEYPVAIGMVFWGISLIANHNNPDFLLDFHNIFFSSFELINVIIFYKVLKEYDCKKPFLYALCYCLLPTNLVLTPFRYESLVNVFFFSGILFYKRNQNYLASSALSIGTAFKWYPTFFLAIAEWKRLLETKAFLSILKNVLIFLAIFLVINVPFIIMGLTEKGNFANWSATYLFHVKRALYWDTPLGVLTLWFGYIPFEHYASLFSLVLMFVFFFIKPKLDVIAKTIIITAAALVFNRAYSTQFHLWFIPLCLVYLGYTPRKSLMIFLIVSLEVLNIFVYPFSFTYSILELDGFNQGVALESAGFWTWGFGMAILIRAHLLVELIIYLYQFSHPITKICCQILRWASLTAIAVFGIYTLFI